MDLLWLGLAVLAAAALLAFGAAFAFRRTLRSARNDHRRRPALWNRFYAFDWGETTTNNYGFAPATGDHPQRFQHQMYRELLTLLDGPARVELSGSTTANWVAKSANLMVDGLGAPERVGLLGHEHPSIA